MKLSYPVCTPDVSEKIMGWCDSYEEAFPFLKQAGYKGIELLIRNPDTTDTKHLNKLLSDSQLQISAIGTTAMQKEDKLFLLEPDKKKQDEAIRRLLQSIELGARFHAPVLIGKYRGMVKNADGCRMENLEEIFEKADQKASAEGTLLLLEPQNQENINNLNTIEESVSWIRKNQYKNVKLLADVFHMDYTEISIEDSLRKYKDEIGMIHMADRKRLVPGFGGIAMKSVLKTLDEIEFTGYISMEINQEPGTKQVAALSAAALHYLEKKEGLA